VLQHIISVTVEMYTMHMWFRRRLKRLWKIIIEL